MKPFPNNTSPLKSTRKGQRITRCYITMNGHHLTLEATTYLMEHFGTTPYPSNLTLKILSPHPNRPHQGTTFPAGKSLGPACPYITKLPGDESVPHLLDPLAWASWLDVWVLNMTTVILKRIDKLRGQKYCLLVMWWSRPLHPLKNRMSRPGEVEVIRKSKIRGRTSAGEQVSVNTGCPKTPTSVQ